MPSRLYVVGTPIGNLGDITYRAVKTLEEVDFIAAEDTRVSAKLLNYLNIKKPMVSYHEHNHKYAGESIIKRILEGQSCAVITDAGMPCISDPGEDLVRLCAQNGVEVVVVPGPSAAISALAISGLDTSRFAFEGFPSVAKRSRYEMFTSCAKEQRTLIFYEAPHKLVKTLEDLCKTFGAERRIALCREMTKMHEEAIRTTLAQAVAFYRENTPKGEFVLVVAGGEAPAAPQQGYTLEEAAALARELAAGGLSSSEAARQAAQETGYRKSQLYTALLESQSP